MSFMSDPIAEEDLNVIEQVINHPRYNSQLTKWERHFMEDIHEREQDLTGRQRKVLNSICVNLGISPTEAPEGF